MGLLTTAARDALKEGGKMLAFLGEFDFVPGIERYWSGTFPLDYDGETWAPTGGVAKVSPVTSSGDFRAEGLEIILSGMPLEGFKAGGYRSPDYKGRAARWIFAIIDSENPSNRVLYAKVSHYFMDTLGYVVNGDELGLRLTLEHESTYSPRQARKRYSDAEQQSRFPGDLGGEFLSYLAAEREIRWGTRGAFFIDHQ